MVKCVSILGSTGSIGRQSLDIISRLPEIKVAALTAGTSAERMAEQCRQFRPELAVMATEAAAKELSKRISDLPIRVEWGETGLLEAASLPAADCVITAVVGMVGLKPTLAAIRAGKRIGLANKETLVCAGELVMAEAEKYHAEIIPVDSEHSAIFQCLMGCGDRKEIKRLILTCSGGPFFGKDKEELKTVTQADALKHPNWKMGAKITIDCATLMNKGLELIEAMHLFSVPASKTDIVIHRESIIHSMVEYIDNTVMAQLGSHDMRLPIQYALTYPDRAEAAGERLDLVGLGRLSFFSPDYETFPLLGLARRMAEAGGNMPCVMNAANEEAVGLFLSGRILFPEIPELVMRVCEETARIEKPSLSDIIEENMRARALTANYAASR